ncbi:MAG: ABC transporter permease [Rubrivivax sp.]
MDKHSGPKHRWHAAEQGWALDLSGDWRGARALSLSEPPPSVAAAAVAAPVTLAVRAAGLEAWDTGLIAALHDRLSPLVRAGVVVDLQALPADLRSVLELSLPSPGGTPLPLPPTPVRGLALLGTRVQAGASEALKTAAFLGEVLMAFGRLLRGTSGMRFGELMRQIDQTGPLSLPIVGLTCFLIGLILAYMGGAQLDRIGAQTFIPGVVTVGMVRELAGLMTGVILSGRIGAAFAAQLATMKAGEEIDALRVLGVDPIDDLVLPRVLALLLVAPLLIAYAAVVGMVAGMLASMAAYGLPAAEYVHQSLRAITWTHLWIGLFKGTLYAGLVALAGCREGLDAGRDARAVGQATTTAVVKSLVWIVMAACLTTVVFQSFGL